jgi:hypothetical protein
MCSKSKPPAGRDAINRSISLALEYGRRPQRRPTHLPRSIFSQCFRTRAQSTPAFICPFGRPLPVCWAEPPPLFVGGAPAMACVIIIRCLLIDCCQFLRATAR